MSDQRDGDTNMPDQEDDDTWVVESEDDLYSDQFLVYDTDDDNVSLVSGRDDDIISGNVIISGDDDGEASSGMISDDSSDDSNRTPSWVRLPSEGTEYTDWQIDVEFHGTVDVTSYLVHRFKLGPQSTYFKSVFHDKHSFIESNEKRCSIKFPEEIAADLHRGHFEGFLDYFYCDGLWKWREPEILPFLYLSDYFGVEKLQKECLEVARYNMACSSSMEWIAGAYRLGDILSIEFIQSTIESICRCNHERFCKIWGFVQPTDLKGKLFRRVVDADLLPVPRMAKHARNSPGYFRFQKLPEDAMPTVTPSGSIKYRCIICDKKLKMNKGVVAFTNSENEMPMLTKLAGESKYRETVRYHVKTYGCKLWCTFHRDESLLARGQSMKDLGKHHEWRPCQYVFYYLARFCDHRYLDLKPETFDCKALVIHVVKSRFEACIEFLSNHSARHHQRLWYENEQKIKVSRMEGSYKCEMKEPEFGKIGVRGAFLNDCIGVLEAFRDRVIQCLSDEVRFNNSVARTMTRERFINDLNMAMSCHKFGETFITKLESLMNLTKTTQDASITRY